jgi:hypothetical protein
MGHVQDTPLSTSMISNVCMICHMKVHILSYNLDQKKISKPKIHILPNYEQTDLKTAIVSLMILQCVEIFFDEVVRHAGNSPHLCRVGRYCLSILRNIQQY